MNPDKLRGWNRRNKKEPHVTPAYDRIGSGEPLVLLHALGLSRRTWDPVVPALSEHFEVIAVDLAGFGDSELLPAEIEPTPAALAELLDDLGVRYPHLVGTPWAAG